MKFIQPRLPLWRLVFGLRKLGDVIAGILQGKELAAVWERDGVVERPFPTAISLHSSGIQRAYREGHPRGI
jgi:hypothetical protein